MLPPQLFRISEVWYASSGSSTILWLSEYLQLMFEPGSSVATTMKEWHSMSSAHNIRTCCEASQYNKRRRLILKPFSRSWMGCTLLQMERYEHQYSGTGSYRRVFQVCFRLKDTGSRTAQIPRGKCAVCQCVAPTQPTTLPLIYLQWDSIPENKLLPTYKAVALVQLPLSPFDVSLNQVDALAFLTSDSHITMSLWSILVITTVGACRRQCAIHWNLLSFSILSK
jgi:hypothetical protein